MMNKKRILVLSIIGMLIIPITVLATRNIGIAVERVVSKEEFDEQRSQEKENWINNQNSDEITYSSLNNNDSEDISLINKYTEKENEVNSNRNTMEEIINRFYADKYKEISVKIEENADKMSLSELYTQPYTEELFDLIIDIIKNKNITTAEKDILKEFLDEQSAFIKENSAMQLKFDEILIAN